MADGASPPGFPGISAGTESIGDDRPALPQQEVADPQIGSVPAGADAEDHDVRAFLAACRIRLGVLNGHVNHGNDPAKPINPRIDKLLAKPLLPWRRTGSAGLRRVHEAEQLLIARMSDDEIKAQAAAQFALAKQLGVATHDDLWVAFSRDGAGEKGRRAAYAALVSGMHGTYRKLSRRQLSREDAANRLNLYGFVLILPIVGLMVLLFRVDQLAQLGPYHILAVMTCGLAGAFFSRMIMFQKVLATIRPEEIATDFSNFAIILRLTIGTLGALVMYFLIVGGVVAGEFFPEWTASSSVWQAPDTGATARFEPRFKVVSADFAQLLLWSTIAGFSERLIPDRFARMEVVARPNP